MPTEDLGVVLQHIETTYEPARRYRAASNPVWAAGAISRKDKQLLALGCAFVTRCEYCIHFHARQARRLGAADAELVDTAFVVSALENLSVDAVVEGVPGLGWPVSGEGDAAAAEQRRQEFIASALSESGAVDVELKTLIAFTASVVKERRDLLQTFAARLEETAARSETLAEAVLVARTMKSGAVYSHSAYLF